MKRIAIIGGELSADNYGGKLIREIKRIDSDFKVYAVGGDKMEREADVCIANIVERAVVGFTEAVREIPYLLNLKKKIKRNYFCRTSPHSIDAIILIDYPGFNMGLAKLAKKYGIKVYYYITPQVWAWGKGRIKTLSRVCDKLFCVFEFEKRLFESRGGDAEFVGHPLLDEMPDEMELNEFVSEMDISGSERVIAVLPGSRKGEVKKILPPIAEALRNFNARVIIGLAPSLDEKDLREVMDYAEITKRTASLLVRADAAVISSGTSNLEAALAGTPFITVYKISPVSYLLAKLLVKVKYVSMVNILAGKEVVKELIQADLKPAKIRKSLSRILENNSVRYEIKEGLKEVAAKLGKPGTTARVADLIVKDIKK